MTLCDDDATCVNGCCKSNPCFNGGTCKEVCEPTSVRYSCLCPDTFVGRHCEYRKDSCQAYKAAGVVTSGLYTIINDSNRAFQVFCDLHAEPGYAWNLIESFSLSNVGLFGVTVPNLDLFKITLEQKFYAIVSVNRKISKNKLHFCTCLMSFKKKICGRTKRSHLNRFLLYSEST